MIESVVSQSDRIESTDFVGADHCVAIGCTIVIPVYNEEDAIDATLDQIHECLMGSEVDYEIVVVNDGSSDGSRQVLQNRDDVVVVDHSWNRGYGAALKSGIRQAKHPWIVITDADGTYPNEIIPRLLEQAQRYDMVVGARTADDVDYPLIRRIPKWFLRRFAQWMARQPIPDINSGLRVFRREVVERFFNILPDGFSFTTTITLAMLTNRYRVLYEPIGYRQRVGRSKIKPIRDTLNFIQLILRTGMYFAPLRVFLPLAAMLFAMFLGSLAYDVIAFSNLTDKTVLLLMFSGNTALFALLADMIDKRVS